MSVVVGIDVAKAKLDVALLIADNLERTIVANTAAGHDELCDWLAARTDEPVHACLEATGRYGEAIAGALYAAGHRVSVENPAKIKAFAGTLLLRTKTDAVDALLIARYCLMHQPPVWNPSAPAQTRLRALSRRRQALQKMRQQERNRLKSGQHDPMIEQMQREHIDYMNAQIKELERQMHQLIRHHAQLKRRLRLLTSIPGIGFLSAVALLAEIPDVSLFASARQLVAYVGLDPRHHSSGSSIRRQTRISKRGNARLRAALYFPAIAAKRFNPLVQPLVQHMMANGHCPMSIIAAVMRKLLHYAFAVLRSGQPFDPNYLKRQPISA
jgi:transposase